MDWRVFWLRTARDMPSSPAEVSDMLVQGEAYRSAHPFGMTATRRSTFVS
jgi:hypothetical protein